MKFREWVGRNVWFWSIAGSIILWLVICMFSGKIAFETLLFNITLASFLVFIGFGQMTVITSGDGAIDLSIPYVLTLSAYISSTIMQGDNSRILYGVAVTVVVALAIGLINGLVVVFLKVPSIITTLATGYITFSIILTYSRHSTGVPNPALEKFTKFQYHGISSLALLCIVLSLIMAIILYRTKFGKQVHAIGQGRTVAELSGINVKRTIILVFMFSALLAGFTGILLGAYIGGAYMDMGNSYMMTSIAAVLVGGTLVSGGKSSVIGMVGGAIMLTLVVTLLRLTKLSAGYQDLIEGAILILILVASVSKKTANS